MSRLWIFALLALPQATLPSAAGDKLKPAEPAAKTLFDGKSLDGWKSTDFFRPGKVHLKDGAVLLEKGDMMTGITYAGKDFPRMNYEVTLEAKKLVGNDFFCTTTFPVDKSYCSLVVGGWGGRVVGISSINGADASENETTKEKAFKHDQWYRVRIRVTPRRVEAWIDQEKLVDLETDGLMLSTRIECIPSQPFGIATWGTSAAIRDIRIQDLAKK